MEKRETTLHRRPAGASVTTKDDKKIKCTSREGENHRAGHQASCGAGAHQAALRKHSPAALLRSGLLKGMAFEELRALELCALVHAETSHKNEVHSDLQAG